MESLHSVHAVVQYIVEMKNPFAQSTFADLQNVSLIKWDLNTGLYDHVAYFS